MSNQYEITKKGLTAMQKTIMLFENTHEIKLYIKKNMCQIRLSRISLIKKNQISVIIDPEILKLSPRKNIINVKSY